MWRSNIPTALLFTATVLIHSVLAQNSTNATAPSCDRPTDIKTNVNSTGEYKFTWNSSYAGTDPWYVSVLVRSHGQDPNSPEDIAANAYISVPGNVPNDTGLCIYQFVNINATLEAGRKNSCNGAISMACVDYLTNTLDASNGLDCPKYSSEEDAFKGACPMLVGASARSTRYIDVTNGTCAYSSLPEMQIPEGYNTFGTPMGVIPHSDGLYGFNEQIAYDLLTRQAIPVVLLGHFVDQQSRKVQASVEFVCLVANKTVEGSRVTKEMEPWKNSAAELSASGLSWVAAGVLAVVVAL